MTEKSIKTVRDQEVWNYKEILSGAASRYTSRLYEIFGARADDFNNAEFKIDVDDPLGVLAGYGNEIIKFKYGLEHDYLINTEKRLNFSDSVTLNKKIFSFIFSHLLADPFICVSERLGIPLFYRELDARKLGMVEQLQTNFSSDLWEAINKINARYALPVRDAINFVRSIPDITNNDSPPEIAALNQYIERMAGGIFRYQENEGMVFASRPRGRNKFALTTNLWSSSIKSLSSLFFYLQHVAKPGQLLMIDEPEIHLTPQNQIILARMLAACVNKGIKVLITTHSDYLVKEFNNLIMLHNLSEAARADFLQRSGNQYDANEMLDPGRVKAYVCQKGKVTACRMDPYGMEVPTMDDAINALNATTHQLIALMER